MRLIAYALAIAAALGSAASANEIILKNGKKVEWRALRDLGDAVDVETLQGAKVTVQKSDIDRIVLSTPVEALTGATFTFDKKLKTETVDILSKIDPKKTLNGEARLAGGSLSISGVPAAHTKVPTMVAPPEEYDLVIVALRKAGLDDLVVGLVGGGKQFNFHFDTDKSASSVAYGCENRLGTVFAKEPRTVRFMVRKHGMVVQVDGRDFYLVNGWEKVSLHHLLQVPDKGVIFIGCLNSSFSIQKMVLTSVKP